MSTATCPLCNETYLAAATVCSDCRVALVLDPPEGYERAADGGAGGGQGDPPAPEALPWPEGEDEVAYELEDWGPEDRRTLSIALSAERVPHEWRDDEIVVPERFADVAEELIDAIDHPDALDEDDEEDDGGAAVLSALYVASDVLSGDPTASGAVVELLELGPDVAGRAAPYGVADHTWAVVVERTAALVGLLESDAEEDDVRPAATSLRGVLRTLV